MSIWACPSTSVKRGCRCILPGKVMKYEWSTTVVEALEKLDSMFTEAVVLKVEVSVHPRSNMR